MRTGIVSTSILCLPLLQYLQSAKEDVCVFLAEQPGSDNDAVASFCTGAGMSCTHEKNSGQSLYDWVNVQQPEIVFVVSYNRVIKLNRFSKYALQFYNVHFGHLPEYRGPNPVFWQLKNGAPSLAITIHYISEKVDAGAIAWKKEYKNEPFFSYGYTNQLMSYYLVEGVNYLLQLHKQKTTVLVNVQDEQRAAYFARPSAGDVCINWKTMSAEKVCDLVKACNPWNNGAITLYNGYEVRIIDAEPMPANEHQPHSPGAILDTSNAFLVACINNEVIRLHSLMVNGVLMPGRFAANYGFVKGQSFNNI
jgi:methionyl-tRNA formyltransferase